MMANLAPRILNIVAIAGIALAAVAALPQARGDAPVRLGAPPPAFGARDIAGKTVRLGDFAGKTIVLEWTNDGCPFFGKHYNSGNMQALPRRAISCSIRMASSATSTTPGRRRTWS